MFSFRLAEADKSVEIAYFKRIYLFQNDFRFDVALSSTFVFSKHPNDIRFVFFPASSLQEWTQTHT